jgi:putative SOS response-associated peptidase YedK
MCGRYALNISGDDLALEYNANNPNSSYLASNWNISPTTTIPFISESKNGSTTRAINLASWGLIPSWAKDSSRQVNAINARVETVSEKPTFREAFKSRRCLVPVSGYYEWATELGRYRPKQPFFISNKENKTLAIAGIYEEWINPESNQPLTTAAIITRAAVGIVAPIHNRMPVILPNTLWADWLTPGELSKSEVADYLQMLDLPKPDQQLRFWPVSDEVNNARNSGPALAHPIALPESETLF